MLHYYATQSDHGIVTNRQLIHDRGIWCDPRALTNLDSAADFSTGDDKCVTPNVNVVSDMNMVVYLCTVFNYRVGQSAAANRSERSNFNMVTDHDASNVWQADGLTRSCSFEAEALFADNGARLDDTVATDLYLVTYDDMVVDH